MKEQPGQQEGILNAGIPALPQYDNCNFSLGG
jgi:hypothetical protein